MNRIERLLCSLLAAAVLSIAAWYGVCRYGIEQRQAGYDAAVADGKEYRDLEAQIARQTEVELRAQLRTRDDEAHRKEQEHAESLEAAQRRVRAGIDSLRCPATRTVPGRSTSEDRPAASRTSADGAGPELVPEVASDVLGYGAAVAGLVRRYERVLERAEACRAVNER